MQQPTTGRLRPPYTRGARRLQRAGMKRADRVDQLEAELREARGAAKDAAVERDAMAATIGRQEKRIKYLEGRWAQALEEIRRLTKQ